MIFKKISARSKQTSENNRITRLIRYVTNPEKSISPDLDESQTKTEKCTYFRAVNYFGLGLDIEQICRETIELAEQKHANASNVFCHYLLSFDSYYKPSNSDIDFSVNTLIERFGMQDCQYIYGRHDDTNNTHVHILINRVNTVTYQTHRTNGGFDIKAGQEAREVIERALKLKPLAKNYFHAYLPIELRTGFESKNRTIHKIIMPIVNSSQTWAYFHLRLHENNIAISPSREGLAIFFGSYCVAASQIDGSLSRKNLEKKFDSYMPPKHQLIPNIQVDEQFIALDLILEDKLRSAVFAMYQKKHQRYLELNKHYLQTMAKSLQDDLLAEQKKIEQKLKHFAEYETNENVMEVALMLQHQYQIFKAAREKHWAEETKKLPAAKDYYFDRWCKVKNINIKKFYKLNQNLDFEKQRIEIRINPTKGTPLDKLDLKTIEIQTLEINKIN